MILLVRVDERLIHGQVTVAWRGALDLDTFAVVDDELAGSDWEKDLVLAAAPDGTAAEIVTVADAVRLWSDWKADARRRMVLVQSFASARSIFASGVDLESLNVGGLHKREGRKEFLPYVWLDSAEMETCRYLCRSGVTLEAQNVPATSGVNLCARIGDS